MRTRHANPNLHINTAILFAAAAQDIAAETMNAVTKRADAATLQVDVAVLNWRRSCQNAVACSADLGDQSMRVTAKTRIGANTL